MFKKIPSLILTILITAFSLSGCFNKQQEKEFAALAPDESKRLVIYTSHKKDVYQPIIEEFEHETGIWTEIVAGGTNEILSKIASEKDSPKADVMFGGGVDSIVSHSECFTPYKSKYENSLEPSALSEDDLWLPFSFLPIVLIYNNKLVPEGSITGWSSLLEPEYKGKIAFTDPNISGSCFTGMFTYLYAMGTKTDALRLFAENLNSDLVKSSGDILTRVAEGTKLVGITLEETAMQRIAAGDNITIVYPQDGTSAVPDASALVKGAKNEENAKLFLDFTVSKNVQQYLTEKYYRRSVRSDVEENPQLLPFSEILLVNYNVDWVSKNSESLLMSWAFYMNKEE